MDGDYVVIDCNENWKLSWRVWWCFMFVVLVFCMWVIGYVLYKNLVFGLVDMVIMMVFLMFISIVGFYVFGVIWEDVFLV